jgi:PadR family transcriptional regulator, regulatory protein PadR
MQKITDNLKINMGGFLEFFVLKMISGRSHSIGEIYGELKAIGFRTPMGSLYPLLSAFRKNESVISGYEEFDLGGARKTYCLTEKGRRRLMNLKRDWKRLNSLVADLGSKY